MNKYHVMMHTDIDECATSSPCEQICTNTIGSFRCSCRDGFDEDVDGISCNGKCVVKRSCCIQDQDGLLSLLKFSVLSF